MTEETCTTTASPAKAPDLAGIERLLLCGPEWTAGTLEVTDVIGGQVRTSAMMSCSVQEATEAQRQAAVAVLARFGIKAHLAHSRSMGDVDVLRVSEKVEEGVTRLRFARHISNPGAWRENSLSMPGKADVPLLNLNMAGLDRRQQEMVLGMLNRLGVAGSLTHSRSLGGVDVLRVAGAGQIARLRAAVCGLAPASPAVPDVPSYPAATHIHSVRADGMVMVHFRTDDASLEVDNPLGPAVCGPKGERYALGGQIMDKGEWQKHPRVVAAKEAAAAPLLRPR